MVIFSSENVPMNTLKCNRSHHALYRADLHIDLLKRTPYKTNQGFGKYDTNH